MNLINPKNPPSLSRLLLICVLPIVLIGMAFSVLAYRTRNLAVDKFCLLSIFLFGSVLYLRNRWLAALAVIFGSVTFFSDSPRIGGDASYAIFRRFIELRFPPPRVFDLRDFVDFSDNQLHLVKIEQELDIYEYFFGNSVFFLFLLIVQTFLKIKRGSFVK